MTLLKLPSFATGRKEILLSKTSGSKSSEEKSTTALRQFLSKAVSPSSLSQVVAGAEDWNAVSSAQVSLKLLISNRYATVKAVQKQRATKG